MKYPFSSNLRRLVFFILALAMLLAFAGCKQADQPAVENVEDPVSTSDPIPTDPTTDPTGVVSEPQIDVTMGTVTTDRLNIRKDAGSDFEVVDHYSKGDRVEILETKAVEDTVWGKTSKGWIGMGYVRMDGTAATDGNQDSTTDFKIISNGDTTVLGYGVVDLGELNVRLGPGTDYDKVGTVTLGARYAYYQISSVSGNWARIEDGWVSTDYFYLEGTTADDAISCTVNTDELNIRTGPDTSFKGIGTYREGEIIEILAQVGSWGYTEEGWVFMTYLEPVEPTYTTGACRITSGLNIRKEPNPEAEIVGSYSEGDGVTILEVQGNWGRTIQGWINLKYVKYE